MRFMGRVSLDGGYARFRETFAVGRMGDNHITTHGFRQQPEAVNLLEDNELKAFVWLDDYGIPFVTTCHFRTGVA